MGYQDMELVNQAVWELWMKLLDMNCGRVRLSREEWALVVERLGQSVRCSEVLDDDDDEEQR